MSTLLRFTSSSPERGWDPFLDWMRGQGLDPHEARSLTVDLDTMTAHVVEFRRNGAGRRYLVGLGDDRQYATSSRSVPITTAPPQRTA